MLPDAIPEVVRTTLLVEALSKGTITGDDPTGQTGLLTQIQQLSDEISRRSAPVSAPGIRRSCPSARSPDDLSTPAGAEEALVGLPPQQ